MRKAQHTLTLRDWPTAQCTNTRDPGAPIHWSSASMARGSTASMLVDDMAIRARKEKVSRLF
jgi:hypothetical protein